MVEGRLTGWLVASVVASLLLQGCTHLTHTWVCSFEGSAYRVPETAGCTYSLIRLSAMPLQCMQEKGVVNLVCDYVQSLQLL
jgi:hypothetical protein